MSLGNSKENSKENSKVDSEMSSENPMNKFLAGLNDPQRQAVTQVEGPLLVLAGAGSGKTRVLTHRVAHIIASRKAGPDEILAVTFTNKAAKEMEHRISKLLFEMGYSATEPLWISTFHSFCNRILRGNIHLLEYKSSFSIYDDSDQLSQIKKVCLALNISEKTDPAKNFRTRINTAKMHGLDPERVQKSQLYFMDDRSIEVYKLYEQEMKKANALDFGDLLLKVYELFRMYPDVLEMYQNKFKYILVDEYQDTNRIQYLLIKLLSSKHRNLCVVGDEDQSIYSWRGADIQNILDFEKDFPEAQTVKLEENYRSTKNIVEAATHLIKNNIQRKNKTLFTQNQTGDLITIHEDKNEYDEARWVSKKILDLLSQSEGNYADYAVFYRTNAQSRVLEEQFRLNSIPYQIVGGMRFFDRLEIKDILCYLKLIQNESDDMALKRIINVPTRGIGKTTFEQLEQYGLQHKISVWQSIRYLVDYKYFNSGITSKLRNFQALIDELKKDAAELNLLELYTQVLEKTQYIQKLKVEESPETETRVQNLEELSNAIAEFCRERTDGTLQNFLEEMALVSGLDQVKNDQVCVTMMTMHVSKGLEYPYVFIVGCEENLFPSAQASYDESEDSSLEEERRLAYVGMTRAREKLFLTHTRSRKVWGQEQFNPPSRFLNEIPAELVQKTTAFLMPSFLNRFQTQYGNLAAAGPSPSHPGGPTTADHGADEDFQEFADESVSYIKGTRVKHPTFGIGSVFQTEGFGDNLKISVLFHDQSIKKFVAKYARLKRL